MQKTKTYSMLVRGLSKNTRNTFLKAAQAKRFSANGYILSFIDSVVKDFKSNDAAIAPTPTQKRIAEIIKEQYDDFKGRKMWPVKEVHAKMRHKISDEEYLQFLEKQVNENPRPVYQIHESLKTN